MSVCLNLRDLKRFNGEIGDFTTKSSSCLERIVRYWKAR